MHHSFAPFNIMFYFRTMNSSLSSVPTSASHTNTLKRKSFLIRRDLIVRQWIYNFNIWHVCGGDPMQFDFTYEKRGHVSERC